jgi:hypothetical protein
MMKYLILVIVLLVSSCTHNPRRFIEGAEVKAESTTGGSMQEVSVIIEERLVEFVNKQEMMAENSKISRIRDAAVEGKGNADKERRRAEGRLNGFRLLLERVLDDVSPSDNGWILKISSTDMQEMRGMLDLGTTIA